VAKTALKGLGGRLQALRVLARAAAAMSEDVDKHVTRKYDLHQKLGKGAYGIVWKATDRKSKEVVAVKKIFDAFQNSTDAQRTFREVVFLQQMADHDNIVKLCGAFKADNDNDLYLVFEFMETDLHAVIRANILQDLHKKYIMYQCFKALRFMHSADLVHRDLKPANLLLNSECLCKIADFGLARSLEQQTDNVLTDYVATRWYRAPEILLGSTTYGKAVDMWSMGCIFGEMLSGKPLFTGSSTLNQLELVCEVMGFPKADEVEAMDSQFAKTMLDSLQPPARVLGWKERIRGADDVSLDLLGKLMRYHPATRETAEQGLEHKYCEQFYDPASATPRSVVPVAPGAVSISIDDNDKKTTALYKAKLYESIGLKRAGNKWINPP